jgi:hypothetical protein
MPRIDSMDELKWWSKVEDPEHKHFDCQKMGFVMAVYKHLSSCCNDWIVHDRDNNGFLTFKQEGLVVIPMNLYNFYKK